MTEEEKKAIERIDYIQDFIIENGQYNADVEEMHYFSTVLNLIQKQDTEINKLKRVLDEMANTLDLNLSLSLENYKFGKKEKIKEYFMKEDK